MVCVYQLEKKQPKLQHNIKHTANKKIMARDLKQLVSILNRNDIEYWAHYGTLLGIIRDDDFIAWDDDIDLGCFWPSARKIYELESEFKSKGWKMIIKHGMITLLNDSNKIDFFIFSKNGDLLKNNCIVFKNPLFMRLDSMLAILHLYFLTYKFETRLSKNQFQKYKKIQKINPVFFKYFLRFVVNSFWKKVIRKEKITTTSKKYVLPFRDVDFKGFKVTVPNNSEKYLEKLYGENWTTPIIYDRFKKDDKKSDVIKKGKIARGRVKLIIKSDK
jgi:lipopolysaccharide cholinephosphotransferase